MQAPKLSDATAGPVQLSLRSRHPAVDPESISTALVARLLVQLRIAIEVKFEP
jgi:hypothetical protein